MARRDDAHRHDPDRSNANSAHGRRPISHAVASAGVSETTARNGTWQVGGYVNAKPPCFRLIAPTPIALRLTVGWALSPASGALFRRLYHCTERLSLYTGVFRAKTPTH